MDYKANEKALKNATEKCKLKHKLPGPMPFEQKKTYFFIKKDGVVSVLFKKGALVQSFGFTPRSFSQYFEALAGTPKAKNTDKEGNEYVPCEDEKPAKKKVSKAMLKKAPAKKKTSKKAGK